MHFLIQLSSACGVGKEAIIEVEEEIELHEIIWLFRVQHQSQMFRPSVLVWFFFSSTFEWKQIESVPDIDINAPLVVNGDVIFYHTFDGHSWHRQ